ncbi:MAG TPA: 3D domain-containing protein [Bacillota bacterium]|nr:3D domain-containing protein [Bacillota bacterium]
MKLIHTTYILTTIIFVLAASFLLTRSPNTIEFQPEMMEQVQLANQQKLTAESQKENPQDVLSHLPKVQVVATGYYAGVESTGKGKNHPEYGITYSGVRAVRGTYSTIAADLNVFPLGSILYIPGYGYGIVADIGSAIKGNKIDLYYDTIDDVFKKWGKKTVDVYVVKKGTGTVTEAMMKELNSKQVVEANSQKKE